jgi:RTX calcium-binding nonapeptide repeat (4 copies)
MRLSTALAGLLAFLVLTPGAASAATVSKDGGTVTFTAGPGETNKLLATRDTGGTDDLFDDTVLITASNGAQVDDPTVECRQELDNVRCPRAGTTRIVVLLGDGDDENAFTGFSTVFLGAFTDGGEGADVLRTLYLGTMVGGPGIDAYPDLREFSFVSYADKTTPITATFDGVANDGAAGEPENVPDGAQVVGGSDADRLTGDERANGLFGGPGDDALIGGPGADAFDGGPGDDTLQGDDGGDRLDGGAGNDSERGGDGQDRFFSPFGSAEDSGADLLDGGPDFDTYDLSSVGARGARSISFDGQANDGVADERDQVVGIEDVLGTSLDDTLTGGPGFDRLSGQGGKDTIDGGPGPDELNGGSGDDTVNARDGFADRVDCGIGTDTAVADQLDEVSTNCESTSRERVAIAADSAPSVATPTTVAGPPASTPPPAPQGSRRRATAALRAAVRAAGTRVRTSGRVVPPAGLSRAIACASGQVSVQVTRRARTLSTRRVALRADCTFSSTVRLRGKRLGDGRLRVTARFLGNDRLLPRAAPTRAVRVAPR